LLDLLPEVPIFLAYSPQVKIVMPEIAAAMLYPHDSLFERSDRIDCPNANQPAGFVFRGAFDLYGEAKHLEEQNSHQDGEVTIAAKDRFHGDSF
jgi:hypothetical protein